MEFTEVTQKWDDIKGKIKGRWEQLTDEEIESLGGNLDELVNLLQTSYGYAKEKAEEEYKDFRESLDVLWKEMKRNKIFGLVTFVSLIGLAVGMGALAATFFRKKK